MKLRIGTRGSRLALVQAEGVKTQLSSWFECEILPIETKGDKVLDKALHKVGDKGLFTAELETALLNGEIDLAVHCLKDLPTQVNEDLPIAAITQREEPWDCVIFSDKFKQLKSIHELPSQSIIGTSSLRRIAQLKAIREDFEFIHLRGNVGTRLQKIAEERDGLAAGILALAGLKRLNLSEKAGQILTPELMLPAPGQGALAIQISSKKQSPQLSQAISKLHHPETAYLVGAERAALHAIDGGCQTPFGAYAQFIGDNKILLKAVVGKQDSAVLFKDQETGLVQDFELLGKTLGERLKKHL